MWVSRSPWISWARRPEGVADFCAAALHDIVHAQLFGDLADGLLPVPVSFDEVRRDDPGAP